MEDKKKFTLSTDTDLHFDMLADKSKIKNIPKPKPVNISLTESETSQDILDSDSESDLELDKKSSPNANNVSSPPVKTNISPVVQPPVVQPPVVQPSLVQPSIFSSNTKTKNSKSEETELNLSDSNKYSTENETEYSKKSPKKPSIDSLYEMEEVPFHMLDEKTKKFKKMEKYAQLLSIKNSGIKLTKEYNLNSDYDEMCFEVEYWHKYQQKKEAVAFSKNILYNAVNMIEILNETYDPFGFKLKDWSERFRLNMSDYDQVLGDIYEKHKDKKGGKWEPEFKLLFMVLTSAATYHGEKKIAEKLPGVGNILGGGSNSFMSGLQSTINKNISKDTEEVKETEDEKQRKLYEQMQNIKAQQKKLDELKKTQEDIELNNTKIQEQMSQMNNVNKTSVPNNPNINSVLNRIKAQNASLDAEKDDLCDSYLQGLYFFNNDKKFLN